VETAENVIMADEKPTLHIDTDWKRQAQEEKRRLAEQEKQRAAGASPAPSGPPPGAGAGAGAMPSSFGAAGATAVEDEMTSGRAGARPGAAARGERAEAPPATLAGLLSQLMTQTLFYLGELAPRGGEPMINLDMAKHNIDLLGVLEEKTRGNLTPEEKRLLDSVLYELRMRYVSVASQYIT
jgi:hypothetical protein